MTSSVDVSIVDHIAHVRLDRPEKRNAIDGPIMSGLIEAATALAVDDSVRVVVVSGNGPSFCAGLDMASIAGMADGSIGADSDDVQGAFDDLSPGGANRAQQMSWLWRELPVPVIAAVHGHALGGGLNLALAADIRIVSPDVSLGFVELTFGLIPDMSGTQALARLVGHDRALQLILSARRFTGIEAAEWGIATEVADDPLAAAMQLATTTASWNPEAVRAAKAVVGGARDVDEAAALRLEAAHSGPLLGSPDQVEAVIANLEGRAAVFGADLDV